MQVYLYLPALTMHIIITGHVPLAQMGMSFLVILEVFKYVGRKHRQDMILSACLLNNRNPNAPVSQRLNEYHRQRIRDTSWQATPSFVLLKLVSCRRLFFLRALGPITVTVLSIAIMNIFRLYTPGKAGPNGIYNVGPIPSGLPHYTGNLFFPFVGTLGKTFTLSVVVCLVDITESISIARALALAHRCGQPRQDYD